MTAKEYLCQYRRLTERIRQLEMELQRLSAQIDSLEIDYSGMPHGSGISDRTGSLAAKLADKYDKYLALKAQAEEKCSEINDAIGKVSDPTLAKLLYDRYIRFMTWEDIAEDINRSDKWTRTRLHAEALRKISEISK